MRLQSSTNVPSRRHHHGLTLVELLVVIFVIAMLVGILLPALGRAREVAKASLSLNNLRQIGIASHTYLADGRQYFCFMSSDPSVKDANGNKPRWADYLYPYMREPEAFLSPNLQATEVGRMTNNFWHAVNSLNVQQAGVSDIDLSSFGTELAYTDVPQHGGYGWNYQRLGNSRDAVFPDGYNANMDKDILAPSDTILVGDTRGSAEGNTAGDGYTGDGGYVFSSSSSKAVYTLDPPAGSVTWGSLGNGKGSDPYYASSGPATDINLGDAPIEDDSAYGLRSVPALRNLSRANMAFTDGHVEAMSLEAIDDSDGNGQVDNGHWNGLGRGDATP